jgi:hypothetical protein
MVSAAQPRVPGRLVTLDPFELGTPSHESLQAASSPDLGCVDWYLYPASRKARPTGLSRTVHRGGVAAPSRENRSA